jgi:hypothetical protein
MAAAVADDGTSRATVLGPWLPVNEFKAVLSRGDVDLLALSCTHPD